jgi:sensor histidine kinase regulating citrate/malate metabolism
LTAAQTYSLFGNIIDNAIEAIRRVEDPEQKVISLVCATKDGCPVIEETNYYAGTLVFEGGIPATIKEDRGRHGFGVRSIRYIAEQYGGTLEMHTVDNMFFLTVSFPGQPF